MSITPSELFVCVYNAGRSQMAEVGIDITAQTPKIITTDAAQASNVVITMGCGDSCPIFPGQELPGLGSLTTRPGQGVEAIRPDPRRD